MNRNPAALSALRAPRPGRQRRDVRQSRPFGAGSASGAKDQNISQRRPASQSPSTARAFAIVASIFAPVPHDAGVGQEPRDVVGRRRSRPPRVEVANAARNAGRLRRMVIHDSPDWNASRLTRSYSRLAADRDAPLRVVVRLVERVPVTEAAGAGGGAAGSEVMRTTLPRRTDAASAGSDPGGCGDPGDRPGSAHRGWGRGRGAGSGCGRTARLRWPGTRTSRTGFPAGTLAQPVLDRDEDLLRGRAAGPTPAPPAPHVTASSRSGPRSHAVHSRVLRA